MSVNIVHHTINSNSDNFAGMHPTSVFLKYRIAIIALAFLSILLFAIGFFSISIFVCFLLFGLLGIGISTMSGSMGLKIFGLVYSSATFFAILFYFIFQLQYGIPYGGGGSDSLGYEVHAEIIAKSVLVYDAEAIGQAIDQPYHNSKGYIYFISLLIRFSDFFGGFHTMIPRLFNASLLGICSVLVFGISQKISLSLQQSINSALVTGLFPIMIYVADQSLRDIPILVLMLVSVYLAINFLITRSFFKHLFILSCFLALFLIMMQLRMLSMINIGIVLGVALFVKVFSVKKFSNKHIFLTIATAVFLYSLILTSELSVFIDLLAKLDSSATDLAEGVDRAGEGGLSLILFNLPTPFNYFGSLFYSFITPLPIVYTTDFDWNFLSLGTVYQFLYIPFVFAGIKCSYRYSLMLPVLFMFLVSFGGYVFGSFTFRHITYIVPFAAIYGVIGYERYKKQRWIIWPTLSLVLVFLLLTYYVIKL